MGQRENDARDNVLRTAGHAGIHHHNVDCETDVLKRRHDEPLIRSSVFVDHVRLPDLRDVLQKRDERPVLFDVSSDVEKRHTRCPPRPAYNSFVRTSILVLLRQIRT